FMVREKAPQFERTVVYPFTVNGEPYVPSARPLLARDDPAQVCLVAYNLGEEAAVDGRVVAADGSVIASARLGEVERTVTGIDGLDKFLTTFDPGTLTVGTYTLQVALTDRRTGSTQTNSIPFSVQ
ncbi:MAG: hypothetical protein ACRD0X_05450, partial [Thermoanaerobaculia bacterium]